MTPEVYASKCCGGLFVPGHGPDNIVEVEQGDELRIDAERVHNETWVRTYRVGAADEHLHDAMREGFCPNCGAKAPGMELISGGKA